MAFVTQPKEKRSAEEITEEIQALKDQLEEVEGTKTEVYTRIVGYYRSLRNWNKGKTEEYRDRNEYKVNKRPSSYENV